MCVYCHLGMNLALSVSSFLHAKDFVQLGSKLSLPHRVEGLEGLLEISSSKASLYLLVSPGALELIFLLLICGGVEGSGREEQYIY